MNILVLLKQVQKSEEVRLKEDFSIDRSRGKQELNPADKSALLAASELRQKLGGQITCITMGPESAKAVLYEGAMYGANRLIHICDPAFAGSDTLATSRILARAIERVGLPDIILCGRRTIDGETGQVGPQLAARLHYSCISNVTSVEKAEVSSIHIRRLLEDRIHTLSGRLPLVLCMCESNILSQLPTLKQIRMASSTVIERISNQELKLSSKEYGKGGSPTQVRSVQTRMQGLRNTRFISNLEDMTVQICHRIQKQEEEET